jgi:hypothetical protein
MLRVTALSLRARISGSRPRASRTPMIRVHTRSAAGVLVPARSDGGSASHSRSSTKEFVHEVSHRLVRIADRRRTWLACECRRDLHVHLRKLRGVLVHSDLPASARPHRHPHEHLRERDAGLVDRLDLRERSLRLCRSAAVRTGRPRAGRRAVGVWSGAAAGLAERRLERAGDGGVRNGSSRRADLVRGLKRRSGSLAWERIQLCDLVGRVDGKHHARWREPSRGRF